MKRRIALFVAVFIALALPLSSAMATMMAMGGPVAGEGHGHGTHHGMAVGVMADGASHNTPSHGPATACVAHCMLPAISPTDIALRHRVPAPETGTEFSSPAQRLADAPPAPPPRSLSA